MKQKQTMRNIIKWILVFLNTFVVKGKSSGQTVFTHISVFTFFNDLNL